MDRKIHQTGGVLLLLAGVTGVLGGVLQLTQPATLAVISEWSAQWRGSEIAIGISGALLLVSTIFLGRHFAGAPGEGWAFLGTEALFFGVVALLGSTAWETRDFSGFLVSSQGGGYPVDPVFGAASTSMSNMVRVASVLLPVSIASYGLGMRKDPRWPRWFAWIGVAVGVSSLGLLSPWILLGAASSMPFIVALAWLGSIGIVLRRSNLVRLTVDESEQEQRVETPRAEPVPWQSDEETAPVPLEAVAAGTEYAQTKGTVNGDVQSGNGRIDTENGMEVSGSGVSLMVPEQGGQLTGTELRSRKPTVRSEDGGAVGRISRVAQRSALKGRHCGFEVMPPNQHLTVGAV